MSREYRNSTPLWSREEKYFQVKELYNYGFSYKDIEKLTDLGKSQISYILKEQTRIKLKLNNKIKRNELKAMISKHKLTQKCVDCGFAFIAEALDLDHKKELKNFEISYGIRNKSKNAVLTELTYCEVRCALCHRYKTFAQEGNLDLATIKKGNFDAKKLAYYQQLIESKIQNPQFAIPFTDLRAFIKDYLALVKESKPCMDCGQTHRYFAMDLDHVRGIKVAELSKLAKENFKDFKVILDEIAKCDLVCVNCHRIRTFERRTK